MDGSVVVHGSSGKGGKTISTVCADIKREGLASRGSVRPVHLIQENDENQDTD